MRSQMESCRRRSCGEHTVRTRSRGSQGMLTRSRPQRRHRLSCHTPERTGPSGEHFTSSSLLILCNRIFSVSTGLIIVFLRSRKRSTSGAPEPTFAARLKPASPLVACAYPGRLRDTGLTRLYLSYQLRCCCRIQFSFDDVSVRGERARGLSQRASDGRRANTFGYPAGSQIRFIVSYHSIQLVPLS